MTDFLQDSRRLGADQLDGRVCGLDGALWARSTGEPSMPHSCMTTTSRSWAIRRSCGSGRSSARPDHPGPLNPPRDAVTSGRPLVNLSLALNHRFGGYDTFGYHVVNVIVHVLSSMFLYGIVRRTLLLDFFATASGSRRSQLGLAVGASLGDPSAANRLR